VAHRIDLVDDALVRQHVARVAVAHHQPVQQAGRDAHVLLMLAVGVVVDQHAQPAQPRAIAGLEAAGERQPVGHGGHVVAIDPDQRPGAACAAQVAVHEQSGADRARLVDVRLEMRMSRHLAGGMVVEVAHVRALVEQVQEAGAVAQHRDVEHVDFVAGPRRNVLQQRDVALEARHQPDGAGPVQAPLHGRAKTVGVAVADIEPHDHRRTPLRVPQAETRHEPSGWRHALPPMPSGRPPTVTSSRNSRQRTPR